MPVTDSIADMLTRIRNGAAAGHKNVSMPTSKIKVEIARILKEEGYILGYEVVKDEKSITPLLKVELKYGVKGQSAIRGIRRYSKPGLRQYVGYGEIPRVQGGLGVAILTTSKGIMTDMAARRQKIGGEVVCFVW